MSNLRRLLSRKVVYAGLCILALLAMLDPFVRQSIFGPQIDGMPWCVWEGEIRESAGGGNQKGWLTRMLEKVGVRRRGSLGLNLDARAVLPVYMQLADDSDAKVRLFSLRRLEVGTKEEATAIMPIFQRHLDDSDAQCRLAAANALWCLSKDRATIAVVLALEDHADIHVQTRAVWLLQDMAAGEPSLFEHLALLCTAPDTHVRDTAIRSMRHFGKRGVPILRKALLDPIGSVKLSAIDAASVLREDGAELYPELLMLQNDSDAAVRRSAGHALYRMDPKRFAKPGDLDRLRR